MAKCDTIEHIDNNPQEHTEIIDVRRRNVIKGLTELSLLTLYNILFDALQIQNRVLD